jgi:predicted TIM-barrel fold metal-dependent hydrolase
MSAALRDALRERAAATLFVDTHEHLLEERTRLAGPGAHDLQPCDDAALLFFHYARDDLWSAGMPPEAQAAFYAPDRDPGEKWPLVEPYWRRARHTGYLRAIAETVRLLYGVEELDAASFVRVGERMRAEAVPGFYRRVLRQAAGVELCQVNSLQARAFQETEYPDLLQQDLSLVPFSTGLDRAAVEALSQRSGLPVGSLGDWHRTVDWAFATYGPRADAVKSQAAYQRRLDYDDVPAADASPLFDRLLKGETLTGAERKVLEDHLMRRCVAKAVEHDLPIKLHCGYYAGTDRMPLERVRRNAADLCPLLRDYPEARFVLMHVGYPYQDEYVALAKHYRNVTVDLCWAWIVSPAACVRFVKEFLLGAPSNKLLTFGGDYTTVESVVGHAALARQGLVQALAELVDEGWLREGDAVALVEPLMRGNAGELFPSLRPGAAVRA